MSYNIKTKISFKKISEDRINYTIGKEEIVMKSAVGDLLKYKDRVKGAN